jgi:methionyl-tRNA formyltransferase
MEIGSSLLEKKKIFSGKMSLDKNMKIIFASNSTFGALILKKIIENNIHPSLLISTSDKKIGRGQQIKSLLIKDFAKSVGVKIKEVEKITDFHNIIEKEKPDLVIVTAIGLILPQKTLDLSFFVNIHPSLLPKYRGATPIQSTIIDGVLKSGVSLIKMNDKIDSGAIIAQKKVSFDGQMNYEKAEQILADVGADLIIENISSLLSKKVKTKPQDENKATYTKKFTKEDGRINWSEPAEVIARKVRALNPWPGTYSMIGEKRFKILEAETQSQTENGPFGSPGKVYLGTNHTIAVQTGKDFLLIKKLQIEGKSSTNSKDFLQGNIHSIGINLV